MKDFIVNEDGASVVEYGMIIGLVGLVAIVALHLLGLRLHAVMFEIFSSYLRW